MKYAVYALTHCTDMGNDCPKLYFGHDERDNAIKALEQLYNKVKITEKQMNLIKIRFLLRKNL